MTQKQRELFLIDMLLREQPRYLRMAIPQGETERWKLLRSLFNVRPPIPVGEEFLEAQDQYLQELTARKGVVEADDLPMIRPGICLWQGDITALPQADAIVNAANDRLLGCFVPCHGCIDNVIHTYAGVQLRLVCEEIMERQGAPEETGRAKITPGFNLPARHVLHTVGPIVAGELTETHCRQLESCYQSCLQLAEENHLRSVAFCCISTGEFHFPQKRAAQIAVQTVEAFLPRARWVERVIFNVFTDRDWEIYQKLLAAQS